MTQAKRHGTTGNISAQMATLSVSQSPVDTAPTPSSYAQLRTVGHGPGQNHGQSFSESGAPHGGRGHQGQLTDAGLDDPRLLSDHQAINFSQVDTTVDTPFTAGGKGDTTVDSLI